MNLVDTIEKFKFDFPSSSFNVYLGKRRSGKSVLCEYIISSLFNEGKIDCCFLFSETDAGFDIITDPECRFTDIDNLYTILENYELNNEYNKLQNKKSKQIKIRTAIVIDDMAIKLKTKEFNILEELSTIGRHKAYPPLSLSFHILAQSLTKIPRVVRLNTDIIFLNQISSLKEVELVLDENLYILSSTLEEKRSAKQLYYDIVLKDDFAFMAICNYKQNCREYKDYLFSVKAKLDKNGKVEGENKKKIKKKSYAEN